MHRPLLRYIGDELGKARAEASRQIWSAVTDDGVSVDVDMFDDDLLFAGSLHRLSVSPDSHLRPQT